jgi:hypothetical protein
MQPYIVVPPVGPAACVLFDSPHSGRVYPDDFGASATMCELRRAEVSDLNNLIDSELGFFVR